MKKADIQLYRNYKKLYLSNTIWDPRAVVVKLLHTAITYSTMLRANRSYYLEDIYRKCQKTQNQNIKTLKQVHIIEIIISDLLLFNYWHLKTKHQWGTLQVGQSWDQFPFQIELLLKSIFSKGSCIIYTIRHFKSKRSSHMTRANQP